MYRWSAIFMIGLAGVFASAEDGFAASRGLSVELRGTANGGVPISESVQLYANSYALVIGVDDYARWMDLSNAVGDAKKVANALERKGFSVQLETNLKADALEQVLEDFFYTKGAAPDARLFVWFAGHGYTLDGQGYVIPSDGYHPKNGVAFRRKALSLKRFEEYVLSARSKHVFAIFDSCFAGTIFDGARSIPPPAITQATTQPVRQFISSGGANQEVSDDGTFAQLFVDAIEGRRDAAGADGYLTGSELGHFLYESVANYSNNTQTPHYGKLRNPRFDQGDFVFKVHAGTVVAAAQVSNEVASAEVLFWEAISTSKNAADYQAYLDQYPGGTFAGLARSRIEGLQFKEEGQEPSVYTVDGVDWQMRVRGDSTVNVRSGPATTFDIKAKLYGRQRTVVTGAVQETDWYRVQLSNGKTGFVFASLLEFAEIKVSTPARQAVYDRYERPPPPRDDLRRKNPHPFQHRPERPLPRPRPPR